LASISGSLFASAEDRFYETPENRPIPIIRAMEIVTLKFNGHPDSCISEQTRQARQVAGGLKTQQQADEAAYGACFTQPKATKATKADERSPNPTQSTATADRNSRITRYPMPLPGELAGMT
jgi:hypothetical protein